MAAVGSWFSSRLQLGTKVFERGATEKPRSGGRGWSDAITALLRACLVVLVVLAEVATASRFAVPFWSVADALEQMQRMMEMMGAGDVGLEVFLPGGELIDAPQRERRCRAAVASTFVGGLERA